MQPSLSRIVFPACFLAAGIFAQNASQDLTAAGVPIGRPPVRDTPKPGPCPLPILPALPTIEDASFFAKTDAPHGTIERVTYKNYEGAEKSMRVYLPPGYSENGDARFPVLYLNHGGGGDDTSWTSESRAQGGSAQYILDNLIAGGKAKPMLIAMPDTSKCASYFPSAPGKDDACTQEYLKDVIPYIESHYRVRADRDSRALAGLSMGGFVVMHTGLPHLDTFSELYIYSSGHTNEETQNQFAKNFETLLKDPETNNLFRVPLYMGAGETDIALKNGQKDLALFNRYGLRNFWVLSTGGHEWANWRRYLYQTAQVMFPACGEYRSRGTFVNRPNGK
jgi:enterochelin esterase-like enzyme